MSTLNTFFELVLRIFEVVDVGAINFIGKLKLKMRGIKKSPAVIYEEKNFVGFLTKKIKENFGFHSVISET